MDTISIKDLVVFYRVGVPDAERSQPQRLLISLDMVHDFSAAAASDALESSIDYSAVSARLAGFGGGRSWKLIETLASDIATMILSEFRPRSVSVRIKKFVIPEARHVSVSLTRPGS